MLLFSFISVFILIFSNSDQNIISTQTSDQHQSSFFILTFNLCSLRWGIISALHKAGWVHCHIYKYSPSSHMHTPLRTRAHTHTHTHTGFLQEEEKNWNKLLWQISQTGPKIALLHENHQFNAKKNLTIWLLSGQQGHERRLCFYTWIYFSFTKHAGFLPLHVLCLERAYLVFHIEIVLAELCRSTSIILYLSLSNAISYTHSFNDRVSNSDEIAFLTVLCRLRP